MRPSERVGSPRLRALASCMPAMVATMKVPPTSSAASSTVSADRCSTGTRQPSAISAWLPASTWRRAIFGNARLAKSVEAAAAAPNTGQAAPKTAGSSTTARASTGRKVAGRM